MAKRVAIIGAGCSGLVAIKSCIEEGLEPVCIERTNFMGGLWRYTPEYTNEGCSVSKSTVINTSKEMMCYSDYPIPPEFPNFMHNTKCYQYFIMYAKHFGLENYIRFQTDVLSLKPADDFKDSGRWVLEVKDLKTNDVTTEIYDAVMACTGHHASMIFSTLLHAG